MSGIYGLSSTRDRKIRYIGKAVDLDRRENEHRYYERQEHLSLWIREERWYGFDLVFDVIERCTADMTWHETYWMNQIRPTFNVRKNWWSTPSRNARVSSQYITDENRCRVQELTDRSLDFVENWRGCIGIRYFPRGDIWRVHVQTPGTYTGSHHWLGDFRDANPAIDARDRFRNEYFTHVTMDWKQYCQWEEDNIKLERNHTGDLDLDIPHEYFYP